MTVEFKEGIPVDKSGVPMVKISFASAEKVPTGNYANVDIGPVVAEKYIPDPGDQEELARQIAELAKPVEWAIAHRRHEVLKALGLLDEKDDS